MHEGVECAGRAHILEPACSGVVGLLERGAHAVRLLEKVKVFGCRAVEGLEGGHEGFGFGQGDADVLCHG